MLYVKKTIKTKHKIFALEKLYFKKPKSFISKTKSEDKYLSSNYLEKRTVIKNKIYKMLILEQTQNI